MNDFEGLLSTDYGFKPQGKSAPMAPPPKSNLNPNPNSNPLFNFDIGPSPQSMSPSSSPFFDRHEDVFKPNRKPLVDDFSDLGFGGDVFSASNLKSGGGNSSSPVNLDSIFGGGGDSGARFSSLPVFDRPMYDEDVAASSAKYEDLFSSSSAKKVDSSTDVFDDLYGGLDKKESRSGSAGIPSFDDLLGGLNKKETRSTGSGIPAFDDLLPGFNGGGSSGTSSTNRAAPDAAKKSSPVVDDPFVVLESTSQPGNSSSGIYSDPLEEIGNLNSSGRSYVDNSSSGGLFDDVDPLDGFGKGAPVFVEEKTERESDESSIRTSPRSFVRQSSAGGDKNRKSSVRSPERATEKKIHVDDYQEPPDSIFDMPSYATDSHKSVPNATSTAHSNAGFRDSSSRDPASPTADENIESSDDIWLTVSEIPLFTQPTAAPPPSRPPPPRPARFSRAESGSYAQKKTGNDSSFTGSPFDELDDFSVGTNRSNAEGGDDGFAGEDFDTNSVAAAAMKEAVDRAEAKFRHARGVRERENAKASKDREALQVEKEEKASQEAQERAFREHQDRVEREKQQREREEGERRRRDEEERRRIEKENEEKERDKRRIERERELARQAVERASREARERAAIEARVKSERAAVQRAQAEARERAGKAAVQRVQTEARERAAADAKERAEKSAAEARERERARAEAREREAREKAAAASRANQSKNEDDLESFFGMGSRASSAPKHRTGSSDPFETQFQSKPAPQATRTSVNSSNMRKASSSTNIVDDLSSIFGAPPSAGDFQNVEGETIERRRARLDRHQRTQERAANALAEKNARDLEAQREQQEIYRFSDSLDVEIKRWSAGKEGNLRALLSTLQYVLWPECGWQPVSLTDLIVGASVKKAYRKATLCIHPDKVQQKGATLQQKYVSGKVFDLLKEAWNKFNSEELF